jgi:hypothetical protein
MRRLFAAAAIALSLSLVAAPAYAATTWEAETKGLPASTQLGIWTEQGPIARLDIGGGHLIGEGTRFVGTWESGWIEGKRFFPWSVDYQFLNINEIGEDVMLRMGFRTKYPGHEWERDWFMRNVRLEPGVSSWGGEMGVLHTTAPRFKVQWKVEGLIKAPSYLDGHIVLSP